MTNWLNFSFFYQKVGFDISFDSVKAYFSEMQIVFFFFFGGGGGWGGVEMQIVS